MESPVHAKKEPVLNLLTGGRGPKTLRKNAHDDERPQRKLRTLKKITIHYENKKSEHFL